ncbi:MAG: nucleotide exchange factor GrpE [Phycisphaeraceae bacterium]|nr:nucleotide exchange factor GrpE [Phycisphaeraceae bacterium]
MNDKPTPPEVTPNDTPDITSQVTEDAELKLTEVASDDVTIDDQPLTEVQQLELELQQAKDALAGAQSRELRANADYQNMARRSIQSVNSAREQQTMSMARDLLTVMDQFDQALEMDPEKTDTAALLKGVEIVRDTLLRTFESFGIKRVDVKVGEEFDPMVHEAMMKQAAEGIEANHVTMQLQPGYMLKDKTLRPAKVAVAQ